jgi:hypothetical protein
MVVAGKARTRPSFQKYTRRYKVVVAPAKVLEGRGILPKSGASPSATVSRTTDYWQIR